MKLVLLIIIIIVVVFVVMVAVKQTKENFWMTPSRVLKTEKVFKEPDHNFFSTSNFQSQLSPRFSNVNYGANIRSEFPNPEMLGVPINPISGQPGYLGGTYKEGFNGISTFSGQDGYTGPSYAAPMYREGGFSELPSDQTEVFFSQDGTVKQPIVYDRYMYANRNSRLRGQGDPIRGDLPIAPMTGNWFVPSATFEGPNVVLQQGAMNVLGGVNNETSTQLSKLIYESSGKTNTTIGGVDLSNYNMSNSFYGTTAVGSGDVAVTSFP